MLGWPFGVVHCGSPWTGGQCFDHHPKAIGGQKSPHRSLSPQKEKSRIVIKPTVPYFTPHACASAVEGFRKERTVWLNVRFFSFLDMLVTDLAPTAVTQGQVPGFMLNSDWSI